MALRLRRGTDAERALITPVEGELVWTTDTKELYAGDGTTVGGIKITGADDAPRTDLNELDDVTLGTINDGDVLAYDMDAGVWRAAPAESPELQAGQLYNIGLLGDDSSVLVDTSSNFFRGNFDGDLYDSEGNRLIDADGGIFYDKSGDSILDLNVRGGQFDLRGNVQGSVFNFDLTELLVDHDNSIFNGTLVGDVKGSVFADDSTAIVDGLTGSVNAVDMTINSKYTVEYDLTSNSIRVTPAEDNSTITTLSIGSRDSQSTLDIERIGTLANPGDIIGDVRFSEDGEYVSLIQARRSNLYTTVGFANNNGITQYSDRVIVGGLGFRVDPNNASFGATDSALDIEGVMKLTPQSAAPGTPVEGMIAVADRVTWDPATKGSGASYPVYYDGSSWNALY